jgi:NAD-dependent dihydropyrimidine dehydrogenase PreA subunit
MRIVFCHCAYAEVIAPEARRGLRAGLAAGGIEVQAVADLCELAAARDAMLAEVAAADDAAVVACHPRAVRSLFAAAGAALSDGTLLLDLRAQAPEDILPRLVPADRLEAALAAAAADRAPPGEPFGPRPAGRWMPWFPVIDPDRCTDCRQCWNFCLFGVFALDAEGHVRVSEPANCKTYCPACGRICPQAAIIFPKYARGPISGTDAGPDDVAEEPLAIDPAKLLGGDVHARLRARAGRAAGGSPAHRAAGAEGGDDPCGAEGPCCGGR